MARHDGFQPGAFQDTSGDQAFQRVMPGAFQDRTHIAFQDTGFQTIPPTTIIGAADITPTCLLYASFNATFATSGTISPGWSPAGAWTTGRLGSNQAFNGSGAFANTNVVEPRRGTISFWARYDTGGVLELISAYPGPSCFKIVPNFGAGFTIQIWFDGSAHADGSVYNQFKAYFTWGVGTWHHIVWTWTERLHRVYVDNELKTTFHADSAFHIDMQSQQQLRVANSDSGVFAIEELGIYNYAFNVDDVNAAYTTTSLSPITPSASMYDLTTMAQWAPGDGRVHVWVDGGNQYGASPYYNYRVYKDGVQIASASAGQVNGYSQSLIQMSGYMQAGTYYVQVDAMDADNNVRSTAQTASYVMPSTIYLGNTHGLPVAGEVPSPYTPITVSGLALSVWGRTYDLTGGWGLPMTITSQGLNMIKNYGIWLQVRIGGVDYWGSTPVSINIDSAADDIVKWTAISKVEPTPGFGVKFTVKGSLEYNGQMLLTMTYEPIGSSVHIDMMILHTMVLSDRTQYYSAAYNQGFPCMYHYNAPVANWNNVDSRPVYSDTLQQMTTAWTPSIGFMDDNNNVAFEQFIDNLSGWSCDLTTSPNTIPCQYIYADVDVGGGVTVSDLQFYFIHPSYNITISTPQTISWGIIAGPTKPVFTGWRTAWIGDIPGSNGGWNPYVTDILRVQIADGSSVPRTQNTLGPLWPNWRQAPGYASGDPDTDTAWVQASIDSGTFLTHGARYWPYHQLHTILGPAASGTYGTEALLNPISQEINISASEPGLGSEASNDFIAEGYQALPTGGSSDYWAYWAKRNVDNRIMQGIYLDEPKYGNVKFDTGGNVSARIIGGSGWTASNLVNYNGYNSQGSLRILRRLKKIFQDAGYFPSIMINYSFGYVPLHMWEPVDAVGDLEGATLVPLDGGSLDGYTAYWSADTQFTYTGAITRTEKFGWAQYILKNSMQQDNPPSSHNFRTWIAMAGLYDFLPEGTTDSWWTPVWSSRINSGVDGTWSFHPYWRQTEVWSTPGGLFISYYKNPGSSQLLLHIANFSGGDWTGTINVNITGHSPASAWDPIVGTPWTVSGIVITPPTIASRDYQFATVTLS